MTDWGAERVGRRHYGGRPIVGEVLATSGARRSGQPGVVESRQGGMMRAHRVARGGLFVGIVALSLTFGATPASARPVSESQGFRKAVTVAGIREHQLALQQIADANGGNRAVGSPGYDASVDVHRRSGQGRGL